MKKWIMILVVLVLLLSACTDPVVSNPEEPSGSSGEPLSSSQPPTSAVAVELTAEMRKEIKEALSSKEKVDHTGHTEADEQFVCGMRYYGTYNGYVILLDEGDYTWKSLKIGETEFRYRSPFQLYAYRDGKLYSLRTVYEDGKVTDGQIAQILKKHTEFAASGQLPYDPPTEEQRNEIKQAYTVLTGRDYAGNDGKLAYQICGMRYYGIHNGYTILFYEGDMTVESGERIGSEMFRHGRNFSLYAWRDGKLQKLKDAYEAGLLREEDIAYIAEIHKMFVG